MRFAVAASGLVAVASASWAPSYGPASNETTVAPVYTTEVVTSFTTYCPEATQLTHNGVTYTVSEATTLTITNCPCTVTKPVYSSAAPTSSAPASSAPVVAPTYPSSSSAVVAPTYPASTWSSSVVVVAPTYPATSAPMYPSANATVPVVAPTGTGVYTTKAPAYTGAASKTSFGAAGLLAALGLVAAL